MTDEDGRYALLPLKYIGYELRADPKTLLRWYASAGATGSRTRATSIAVTNGTTVINMALHRTTAGAPVPPLQTGSTGTTPSSDRQGIGAAAASEAVTERSSDDP